MSWDKFDGARGAKDAEGALHAHVTAALSAHNTASADAKAKMAAARAAHAAIDGWFHGTPGHRLSSSGIGKDLPQPARDALIKNRDPGPALQHISSKARMAGAVAAKKGNPALAAKARKYARGLEAAQAVRPGSSKGAGTLKEAAEVTKDKGAELAHQKLNQGLSHIRAGNYKDAASTLKAGRDYLPAGHPAADHLDAAHEAATKLSTMRGNTPMSRKLPLIQQAMDGGKNARAAFNGDPVAAAKNAVQNAAIGKPGSAADQFAKDKLAQFLDKGKQSLKGTPVTDHYGKKKGGKITSVIGNGSHAVRVTWADGSRETRYARLGKNNHITVR